MNKSLTDKQVEKYKNILNKLIGFYTKCLKENKDAAKRYEKEIKQERQKYLDHPSVKDYKKRKQEETSKNLVEVNTPMLAQEQKKLHTGKQKQRQKEKDKRQKQRQKDKDKRKQRQKDKDKRQKKHVKAQKQYNYIKNFHNFYIVD